MLTTEVGQLDITVAWSTTSCHA